MAKGSQLSQLKSALSQAGLSRQSQPGGNKNKKRKRTTDTTSLDKEKKAKKLEEIQKKLNPFDVKVTKLKHDVGGRKVKGVTGRPGLSKQVGIEQRKQTLLVEYDRRSRAGGILDRRFGEDDPNMTAEERMLERFTREKQRTSSKTNTAFNLEDEDELTHYGQSLNAMDDFDATGLGLDDDEEDPGRIDAQTVQRDHFGGFEDDEEEENEDEPPRKKSKAEVMAEVIAKSKEYKYQRQLEKEEDENIRHQVDQEFNSIRSLLFGSTVDPKSTGSNSVPLGARAPVPQDPSGPPPDEDDYDQLVREIAFEKRAQPTDRTKTEEEIALEEKERLERAERRRLKRMRGEDEDEDEDEESGKGRKGRRAQADDLEDDFVEDEEGMLGKGLENEAGAAEAALEAGSEEETEASDDDKDKSDSGEEDEDKKVSETEPLTSKPSGTSSKAKDKSKELPFTFKCPTTHDEFLEILDGVDPSDVPTVVQRIRVIYHSSLAEDNKLKLQTFCSVLVDHVLFAASPPSPSFSLISSLSPHIFALSKSYPIPAAQAFISKLTLMQKNLSKGLSRGALLLDSNTFPGTAELALLRLIGTIWSTSDLSHPVVAPAMLLMGQYLGQARVRSLRDIASGLFLCTIIHQYQELSNRLVPEAVNFLLNSIIHLTPHKFGPDGLPGSFPSPDFGSDLCKPLQIKPKQAKELASTTPDIVCILCEDSLDEQRTKLDLLVTAFSLVERYAKLYTSSEAFIELLMPFVEVLSGLKMSAFSEAIQKIYKDLSASMARMLKLAKESRKPLRLQAHRPIPIATVVPHFDAAYSARKHHGDSGDKEGSKLRAMYKQERKGAIRELRKDNKFLAGEQARRQEEKDREYNEKMKRVEGGIQVERHEQKELEKEKKREKKRK